MWKKTALILGLVCVPALPVHAYVGPGVGVTLIGWFVGLVLAAGAVLWGMIFWPLKLFLQKVRSRKKGHPVKAEDDTSPTA